MTNSDLKKRILDISYKYKLSHIGSCLTAVDIINEIFERKKQDEKFVLSSGHAGLALYCVLEKYNQGDATGLIPGLNAEEIWLEHGVHPDRCVQCHLDCSAGSLGQGLPIAVGMALQDRSKNVYCLISDGECSEGSIAEALRIAAEQDLTNLKVYLNYNGWGAYKQIHGIEFPHHLANSIIIQYRVTSMRKWPRWLSGQAGHYVAMDEKMYQEALGVIK